MTVSEKRSRNNSEKMIEILPYPLISEQPYCEFSFFSVLFVKINVHNTHSQMYIVQKYYICFYFRVLRREILFCAPETGFHIFDLTFVRVHMCAVGCASALVRLVSIVIHFFERNSWIFIIMPFFYSSFSSPWTATVWWFVRTRSTTFRVFVKPLL